MSLLSVLNYGSAYLLGNSRPCEHLTGPDCGRYPLGPLPQHLKNKQINNVIRGLTDLNARQQIAQPLEFTFGEHTACIYYISRRLTAKRVPRH